MRPARYTLAVAVLAAFLSGWATPSHASSNVIKMGFIGGRSPVGIVQHWSPLLDHLSRAVGIPFQMVMRENYEDLIKAFVDGDIELFEGGALTHLVAMDTGLAEFLVGEIRRGSGSYRSIFVVRTDSGIKRIEDLKGKTLALTDELSSSGYLIPLVMLKRKGIERPAEFFGSIVLTGSHDRSLEAVLEGAVHIAGIGDESSIGGILTEAQRAQLAVIETSEAISYGPVTIRHDVDEALKHKIRDALLSFKHPSPDETPRNIEIDRFVTEDTWDYATLRGIRAEAATIPKLGYVAPYRRTPIVVAHRIRAAKVLALSWIAASLAVVAIVLWLATYAFRKRTSTSAGVMITTVAATLAAMFTIINLITLFSSINAFASKKLDKMENLNLRAVTAIAGASAENLNHMLAAATEDEAVRWAKIFRNGYIIASDKVSEVGISIIDQIRADTFGNSQEGIVQILDPIIVDGKRYATAQLGLSFAPLTFMVHRAVIINVIAMGVALCAGVVATLLIRRRMDKPVQELSKAMQRLREGEIVDIGHTDADLSAVTELISTLAKEMREKQSLMDLATGNAPTDYAHCNPALARLLADRIHEMEMHNPAFKHLRQTEAMGNSPAWLCCMRDAALRACDREPVVIVGPSGSGKTSVARVIHALSPRADKPMGEFNCAEFASGDPLVVLGKLFGYGRDSGIQGISRDGQKGILEEFDGGTLFFDEAGILPMQAQQLLLLPLEGRAFNPAAGKGDARTVNVRIIFATNEPLETLVQAGSIRHDLLRRIQSRGCVRVPPLGCRTDDIELLARRFLDLRNMQEGKMLSFSLDALGCLTRCGYERYNVSELQGQVHRAYDHAVFEHTLRIEPQHLSESIRTPAINGLYITTTGASSEFDEMEQRELDVLRNVDFNITRAEQRLGFASGSKTLTNHFRGIVYCALDRHGWDIHAAAAKIGGDACSRTTHDKIVAKILTYIATVRRHVESNTPQTLCNNLPRKYHAHAERLTEAIGAHTL